MAFTPKKLPAIPDLSRLGQGLLPDVLRAVKTSVETRLLGLHGSADQVILKGELGVEVFDMQVVTDMRDNGGTHQKKTRSIGIVNGIITVIGEETDWVNI